MAEDYIIIMVTAPDVEAAQRLARTLVSSKQAACVSILPDISSLYWWQDRLTEDKEVMLLVKTRASLFDEIADHVKASHPYQTPEIIALPIVAGSPEYLSWISEVTR
jgi:periplasmic divalent cation tolerance protein